MTAKNKISYFVTVCPADAREKSRFLTQKAAERYFEARLLPCPAVLRAETGKPYFAHSDYHLSVTHTGGLHLVAIAPFPVGVDAERTLLSPPRAVAWLDEEEKKEDFARIWTAKEAISKLVGLGLSAVRRVRVRGERAYLDGKTYDLMTIRKGDLTVTFATEGDENGRKTLSEE